MASSPALLMGRMPNGGCWSWRGCYVYIHNRSRSSCRNSSTGIPPDPTMMAWRGLKRSRNSKGKFSKVVLKILKSPLRNSQKYNRRFSILRNIVLILIVLYLHSLSLWSQFQWQAHRLCLWHRCQAVVVGVGELHLKQGIRGTIVFVKSIFGHYQLLLYLLNGAMLQFS